MRLLPKNALTDIDRQILTERLLPLQKRHFTLSDASGLSEKPLEEVISAYFKTSHRSQVKKELGPDAAPILNLCVAYKQLLHLKLVETCRAEEEKISAPEEASSDPPETGSLASQKISDLISERQQSRLESLRHKFSLERGAQGSKPVESRWRPLLFRVENGENGASQPRQVQSCALAVLRLLCLALRE